LERLLNTAGFVAVLCVALVITPLRVAAGPAALVAAALVLAVTWLTRTSRGRARSAAPRRGGGRMQRSLRVCRVHARRIAGIARRIAGIARRIAGIARRIVTPRRLL